MGVLEMQLKADDAILVFYALFLCFIRTIKSLLPPKRGLLAG